MPRPYLIAFVLACCGALLCGSFAGIVASGHSARPSPIAFQPAPALVTTEIPPSTSPFSDPIPAAPTNGSTPTATLEALPIPLATRPLATLPSVPRDQILWSGDDGTGSLAQWAADHGGGIYNSGTGDISPASGIFHLGHPAIALTITNANGKEQAARIFRWKENPVEAYYSAWLYFPEVFHPAHWWNVFQWKSKPDMKAEASDPMWVLNVGNFPNGQMRFYLWDAIHGKSLNNRSLHPDTPIPAGCWIHVEAFYRRATDNTGQVTIWQNGIKLYDLSGVKTAIADNAQWGLANYTDNIVPSTATIYAANPMITKSRVGPASGGKCSQ